MTEWIDSETALARLRVKPQTLYAYVSRGLIETIADPAAPRRSLYRANDIGELHARRSRSRKRAAIASGSLAWGDPSLTTGISTVQRERLVYRGRDATSLADAASLEDVAALLWDGKSAIAFRSDKTPKENAFSALAELSSKAAPSIGRTTARLCRDAQEAIGAIAASCGVGDGESPLHRRLADLWSLDEAGSDVLRRALVLVADHELNVSTFAARVVASSGASLAACLLSGICAFSGPRHGNAPAALSRLLEECAGSAGMRSVSVWLDRDGSLPGFNHPLYPSGDVRAQALLPLLPHDALLDSLAAYVMATAGQHPNLDFSLVAIARAFGLPDNAPFTLFLLGRSVGWAAHAIEQAGRRELIRPRARYDGALPADKEGAR